MARSKKMSRSRKRRKLDWVVNSDTYGTAGNLPNATQVALALTIPKFMQTATTFSGFVQIPSYYLPEQDGGQEAYAVRGHYRLSPGTWAAGSLFRVMLRIVVKPMAYDTQFLVVDDPNYSLFVPEFANEQLVWQRYHYEQFGGGDYGEVYPLNISFKRRIKPDEALFLYVENQTGVTQTVIFEPFLRTLMRADE